MKSLLVISLLLLSACDSVLPKSITGPKFVVGDCIALESDLKPKEVDQDPLESWETRKKESKLYMISRIEEIGKLKYRITVFDNEGVFLFTSDTKISYDHIHQKVQCPKEIK